MLFFLSSAEKKVLILWRAVDASLESCFIPNARILFVQDRSKIPYSIHRQISDVYGYKAFFTPGSINLVRVV